MFTRLATRGDQGGVGCWITVLASCCKDIMRIAKVFWTM